MLSAKGIEFLHEAINTKNKLEDYEKTIKLKEKEFAEKKSELDALKANIEHDIKKSVAAARRNIENMYDAKSDDIEKDIRQQEDARSKSKNEQVSKRIKEKNSNLVIDNARNEENINSLAKKFNVNLRSSSKFYYVLLVPRGIKESIISGLIVLITMLIAIGGIYFLATPNNMFLYLVGFVFLFSFIHMIKTGYTAKNMKYLYESRRIYDKIAINERAMAINANKIKNDPDESHYDLQQYNERIYEYKNKLSELLNEKELKLQDFDTVTAENIANDIRISSEEEVERLEKENDETLDNIQELKEYKERLVRYIVINFDNALGEEFKDVKKIKQLIKIIEEGKASTVEQAIAEYYEED